MEYKISDKLNIFSSFKNENNNELTEIFEEIKSDEKYYDQLIKLGLNDEKIKEYLLTIYSNYKNTKICENCKGFDSCQSTTKHYLNKLMYEDGVVYNEYNLCKYGKDKSISKNLIIYKDAPKEYFDGNLKIDAHKVRVPLLKKFKAILEQNDEKPFVFITSNNKSGSTLISCQFLKKYVSSNLKSGAIIDSFKLIESLNDLYFQDKTLFNDKFNQIASINFLILDKLSRANITEFKRDNILLPLINSRLANKLPTFIISDFDPEQTVDSFNVKNNFNNPKNLLLKNIFDNEFDKFNITLIKGLYK